jgi:sugar phosphate isomerase/epimerase
MTDYLRFNDGSKNAPRLSVRHSLWSLIKLPMNAETEWTLDEKFSRAKAAGFEGIEIDPGACANPDVLEALARYGLKSAVVFHPGDIATALQHVELASRIGANFLFLHPYNAFASLDSVVELVQESRGLANSLGMPMFVETHRNNYTENLPQCLALLERIPDLRFTADLSHLILIGEFYGWEDERAAERIAPILERTSHIHGRISNGEQIQVDVGDGTGQTAQFFVSVWTIAMKHWLKGAGPGDVLPFASELGPPRYAITLPDGREFSDRWEQSLVMKRLAQQAWSAASA